jgi:hypothetical protein
MKFKIISATLAIGCTWLSILNAQAQPQITIRKPFEIPVEGFLAPIQGFDDNDSVEGVVYGYLPNSCYRISRTEVVRDRNYPREVSIKQYALKKLDGACGGGNRGLPADGPIDTIKLAMRVPFFAEVDLGEMRKGSYRVLFRTKENPSEIRPLEVVRASTDDVDNFPYANVLNAMSTEVIPSTQDLSVTLTGTYNSTCTQIDRVDYKKSNDVVIIKPILKVLPDVVCAEVITPFTYTANLGKVNIGHHLIQIRSMNGKAVNRLVTVTR